MSDYTPSTDEVREVYADAGYHAEMGDLAEDFDHWLAKERAEAWDEGHRAGYQDRKSEGQFVRFVAVNPYRTDA